MIKNNFKKICFYLVSSPGLLVVSFLLLLFSFGLAQDAKAYDIYSLNNDNTSIVIPDYTGTSAVLLCSAGPQTTNLTFNTVSSMTQIVANYSNQGGLWFLANPLKGTRSITGWDNSTSHNLLCYLVTGIDTNDPIVGSQTFNLDSSGSHFVTKATSTPGDLGLIFTNTLSNGLTLGGFNNELEEYLNYSGYGWAYFSGTQIADEYALTFAWTNNQNKNFEGFIVELKPASSYPQCTSYTYNNLGTCDPDGIQTRSVLHGLVNGQINDNCLPDNVQPVMWQTCTYIPILQLLSYADSPNYTAIGGNFNIPYVVNVCSYLAEHPSSTLSINFSVGGYLVGSQSLDNCDGIGNFSAVNISTIDTFDYQAYLYIYDDTLDETVINGNTFWEAIYQPTTSGYINFNYGTDSTIRIDTSASDGATTTINFIYNICDDPGYSATSSKIWIISLIGENFQTYNTGPEDYFQAPTCAGSGSIILHLDQGQVGTVKAYYSYSYTETGIEYLKSNTFYIVATSNFKTCEMPSYDIANICAGIDTSGTLGYVQCSIKYAIVASAQFLFFPSCSALNDITNNYNGFKHTFPFNTYFDFADSINTAIDTAISTTTVASSISVPFIRQTATSSEFYMLPVMSSTTVSNTIGTENYNTLRMTLGFVWWLICGAIVFLIVTKV